MSVSLAVTPPGVSSDSRQVFAGLWASHHTAVLAYARRRSPADTAEEVTAATFSVLWRRIDDPPVDPLPWLYAVARKELANHRRGEARRQAVIGRLSRRFSPSGSDVAPDAAGSTVDRTNARAALRRLGRADREVLMLVAWEGLDPPRAAVALGVSEATFAVRLHRARRRLESELTDLSNEES
jgi:RNA polymerase sigma-70 factor (ECF subfamily)